MSQDKGRDYEELAKQFLMTKGLKILESNFYSRFGEIDLVALDQDMLVFIEVRFRKSNYFGGAVSSITYAKQKKLVKTAQLYLASHRNYDKMPCRFDVISINANTEIDWIKSAFIVHDSF